MNPLSFPGLTLVALRRCIGCPRPVLRPESLLLHIAWASVLIGAGLPSRLVADSPFGIDYSADALANVAGGLDRGAACDGVLTLSGSGTLAGTAPGFTLTMAASALHLHGSNLTSRSVGDSFGVSNLQADVGARLFEAYLEAGWRNDALSLRIGRLAADSEFAQADAAQLFVNSVFGWAPVIGQPATTATSAPAAFPIWPFATPAMRLRLGRTDDAYVALGVFDSAVEDPAFRDRHGLDFKRPVPDRLAWIVEAGARSRLLDDQPMTVKIGIWQIDAPSDSLDGTTTHGRNAGWYLVLEQPLAASGITAFAHAGGARSDRNAISAYFDLGLTLAKPLRGRDGDTLGLAFAHAGPSGSARGLFNAGAEEIIELTYAAKLAPHLTLQPELQCVRHPGALSGAPARDALVAGLRLHTSW
jgi:porin